jgi:hypothetical protein
MKINFKMPRIAVLSYWSCWLFSIYFALAELVVRRIGYPGDNTFFYIAVAFLVMSLFPLAEMWRPGTIRKLVRGE